MEFIPPTLVHRVLCADCGTPIEPNSANLCIPCLRNSVDVTEGIPKSASVSFCRNCDRFLSPPATWTIAEPESRELLAICLKKLKGLSKVRLVDAGFIWTEPHSKRLRVKLTIQKEVFTSTIIEQVFEVEYVVQHGQCPDCTKLAAKNTWQSMVQVRQKVPHKRTFLFLEQLILKHHAHKDTISIKEARDGLDLYYASETHAVKMVEFLTSVIPVQTIRSAQLISRDTHSSTANYKFTHSVQIIPICKDDLVCIPAKQARSFSNISPLTVCSRIGNSVHLLDLATLQETDVTSTVYWREPFDALASVTDLVEFIVLDIEPSGVVRGKHVLADAQVAPSRAFMSTMSTSTPSSTTPSSGKSKRRKNQAPQHSATGGMDVDINGGPLPSPSSNYDISATGASSQIYHTRTHLGGVLQPGDTVLGYFLTHSNFNSPAFESLDPSRIPDVILVKKSYPNRRKKSAGRARPWKLKSMAKEAEDNADAGIGRGALGRRGGVDQKKVEQDYELFLRQIEEDEDMRAAINLYKNADAPAPVPAEAKKGKKQPQYGMDVDQDTAGSAAATEEHDGEADFPEVRLDELLDDFEDMHIEDGA